MPSPVPAILDANILFSNVLRNLLLQLALNEAFEARWTVLIEDEWLRNMEDRTRDRIREQTLPLIRKHFLNAMVSDFDVDRAVWHDKSERPSCRGCRRRDSAVHIGYKQISKTSMQTSLRSLASVCCRRTTSSSNCSTLRRILLRPRRGKRPLIFRRACLPGTNI
jgi:hypothetical protein